MYSHQQVTKAASQARPSRKLNATFFPINWRPYNFATLALLSLASMLSENSWNLFGAGHRRSNEAYSVYPIWTRTYILLGIVYDNDKVEV